MKREIHYYYYPGCLAVSLVEETEPHEEWKPMKITRVARLYDPRIEKKGKWSSGANMLTPEERKEIEERAYDDLYKWVKWGFNPNREKGISERWVNEMTERTMSLLNGKYEIV